MNDYLNEDNLDDLEDSDTPYQAISSRPPLEEVNDSQISSAPTNPVANTIASRMGRAPAQANLQATQDPEFLKVLNQANLNSNLARSFSQIGAGVQAPRGGDAVATAQQEQANQMAALQKDSLDRQDRIKAAVAKNLFDQQKLDSNLELKKAMLANSMNKQSTQQGFQANRLMAQAEDRLRTDPLIKPSELNLGSLAKSMALLNNSSVPLTPQMLADSEQDIANALALRGQGATEGRIHRTELMNMQRKLAEYKQKYLNQIVDLRKEAPDLVNQVKAMNNALAQDYQSTISDRKNSILRNLDAIYGDNPMLHNKVQALSKSVNDNLARSAVAQPTEDTVPVRDPRGKGGRVPRSLIDKYRNLPGWTVLE